MLYTYNFRQILADFHSSFTVTISRKFALLQCKFSGDCKSKRILEIDQYLTKLYVYSIWGLFLPPPPPCSRLRRSIPRTRQSVYSIEHFRNSYVYEVQCHKTKWLQALQAAWNNNNKYHNKSFQLLFSCRSCRFKYLGYYSLLFVLRF